MLGTEQSSPIASMIHQPVLSRRHQVVKRGIDVGLSIILLFMTLPLFVLLLFIIPLTSYGPPIYKQIRVGKDGQPFYIFKFRSMRCDAEKKTGPILAMKNDDRVTPLGRIMRATRIDELPQFINVLIGQMSLIGPRPERPFFVKQYCTGMPIYTKRLSVRPGITGYAQVRGTYHTPVAEKLSYDLYYIEHYSIWLDMKILLLTCAVIYKRTC
ncbi:sugar transferase [Lentibacillus saliphilus]|uniref:sugar transferase n=1 Tax=Lentibacillus saliphilus TaxID=2737028 RepID=UPI001C2F157B|nr:sugar transferase [Lentibacillus saliphilus]